MTLALYGKSRKRQGSLLLAALMAIVIGLVLAVASMASVPVHAAPINSWNFDAGENASDVPDWEESEVATKNFDSVLLRNGGTIYRTISTLGYTDVIVTFSCQGDGDNGSSDDLDVSYSINSGTTWIVASTFETSGDGSSFCDKDNWRGLTVDLSSIGAVENISTFALRFRSVGHTDSDEDVNIDNITVSGTAIVADADSDGVADASDSCPTGTVLAPGGGLYEGCSIEQLIAKLPSGTPNTILGPFCDLGDFNFVIDMSGSIGPQGSSPSNLPAMQSGINGFVTNYASSAGSGLYSGTKFNGDLGGNEDPITDGFVAGATFQAAVTALAGPSGLTPTAAGVGGGVSNNANDRPAAPNMMFVVTDGSPNVPPGSPLTDPDTWVTAATAAINAANTARTSYAVRALYVSAVGDPGDTNLPFNAQDDAKWAKAVMDEIDGTGTAVTADFASLGTALAQASGCETPTVTVLKTSDEAGDDGNVALDEDFNWVITVSVSAANTTDAVVIDDSIPAPFVIRPGAWDLDDGTGTDAKLTCADITGPAIQCTVASGAVPGTYIVKIPVEAPSAGASPTVCGGSYPNTAYIRGDNVSGTADPKAGEPNNKVASSIDTIAVTCPEVPSYILQVCKIIDTGSADTSESFTIGVSGFTPAPYNVTQAGAAGKQCQSFTVSGTIQNPAPPAVTVTETPPAGWDSAEYTLQHGNSAATAAAALGSGVVINIGADRCLAGATGTAGANPDCTVTIHNNKELPRVNVTFSKYICKTYGDVPNNEGPGGQDDIGKNDGPLSTSHSDLGANGPTNGGDAVTPANDNRGNCALATTPWDFKLYTDDRVNGSGGTLLQTVTVTGSQSVALNGAALAETLSGNGAYVEEVYQSGYGFGSIKCYTDHLNDDNWEWLNFTGGIPEGTVHCIAYNVPAQEEILIRKQFVHTGSYTPVVGDIPAFVLNPSTGTSCEQPILIGDTAMVVCTVPYGWSTTGIVTEIPKPGWQKTDCPAAPIIPEGSAVFKFCNEPYGTVRIEKFDGVNGATAPLWDFTVGGNFVAPDGTPYTNPAKADQGTPFVSDPIGLSTTPVTVAEVLARSITQCQESGGYYTIATPPADTVINTPGEVQTWTFQNIPCGILGTGGLIIEKYLDINGDGDANDVALGEGPLNGWTFTTTGGGILGGNQVRQTAGAGQILEYISGFDAGTVLNTTETATAGYALTRVTLDGVNIGSNLSNGVVIVGGQTRIIRYYNQPKGSINVHKNAYFRIDNQNSPANEDDDGWTITVVSAACGINQSKATDTAGNASFTGLPLCTDYVVSENQVNALSAGFTPATAWSFSGVAPSISSPPTITFNNEKVSWTPPGCTGNCRTVDPSPTPKTPETPTVVPPTSTPVTPLPTSDVRGERTPGASATPIAPSTGGGIIGGATGGTNLVLIIAGILALTSGLSFVALGRKSRR